MASGSAVILEACGRDFMGGGPGVKKGRLAYLHTYTARHNNQEPPTKLVLVSATSFFSHARDMELYLGKRHRYQFCTQGEYIITLVSKVVLDIDISFLSSLSLLLLTLSNATS